MKSRLAKVLFPYCLTPQTTTGVSPNELLLGRRPRSRLDLPKLHTAERLKKQLQQKEQHESRSRDVWRWGQMFQFIRNYQGDRWLPSVIEQRIRPVSSKFKLTYGRIRRCHHNQVRNHSVEIPQELNT